MCLVGLVRVVIRIQRPGSRLGRVDLGGRLCFLLRDVVGCDDCGSGQCVKGGFQGYDQVL